MNQDLEHLKLLSIFHFVVAGIAGLFSLMPIIHLILGLGLITRSFDESNTGGQAIGWFFVVVAGVFILAGLAFSGCLVAAGRYLAEQSHYTFCLVMAGVCCIFMPFGTVLGVFTILVLVRPSVKELFGVLPNQTQASARLSTP